MSLIPNFAMLGNGPSVLMLHDADTDHLGFAPQVELLASQGYRAIAWDMPGYHRNPPPYGGYSLAALATCAAWGPWWPPKSPCVTPPAYAA